MYVHVMPCLEWIDFYTLVGTSNSIFYVLNIPLNFPNSLKLHSKVLSGAQSKSIKEEIGFTHNIVLMLFLVPGVPVFLKHITSSSKKRFKYHHPPRSFSDPFHQYNNMCYLVSITGNNIGY